MFLKVFLSVIKIKYHIYLGMILTKINSIHLIFARFHIKGASINYVSKRGGRGVSQMLMLLHKLM